MTLTYKAEQHYRTFDGNCVAKTPEEADFLAKRAIGRLIELLPYSADEIAKRLDLDEYRLVSLHEQYQEKERRRP